jgi:hypothetical protein
MTPKDPPTIGDIAPNADYAAIEIYTKRPPNRRHHLYLPEILWQD